MCSDGTVVVNFHILNNCVVCGIGGGDGGGHGPPTFMGHCLQEKIEILFLEQSGSGYSNRQLQYSEKQCSKLLSYVCVVIIRR